MSFVQSRMSATKPVITDLTGKVLHVGDRVVTFTPRGQNRGLLTGRIVRMSPILAEVVVDEGDGYRQKRIPSQLSRLD